MCLVGPLRFAILALQRKEEQMNHSRTLLHLLRRVLGVLVWGEFAGFHVALVQFRILLPLLRQVVQRKNRGHGTDRDTGATIDAFHRINVELGNAVECWAAVVIGRVLLGVDAIYGTASTQAVSLVPMQGSAMTKAICHLPLSSTLCLPERRFKGAEVNS